MCLLKLFRRSRPEVFLGKGVVKIYSKFTGEYPYQSLISIKLQSKVITLEITLRHGCSPVNLQHIFRTPFPRNTHLGDCFWLLLEMNIKFYAIPTELWWYYWDLVVKGGENSFVDLFLNISVTIRLRYKSHIEWILQTDNGSFCLFPLKFMETIFELKINLHKFCKTLTSFNLMISFKILKGCLLFKGTHTNSFWINRGINIRLILNQ